MRILTLLLIILANQALAQSGSLEKVIAQIDVQTDPVKAIFDWVCDNIHYDVRESEQRIEDKGSQQNSKYKTEKEYKEASVKSCIYTKRGVCEHYSLLFDALVKELGYEAHIIEGFTKNGRGKINYSIGHSWNAVKVDGQWKLYDPTWAAGYVNDKNRFVKEFFIEWYDVDPNEMIKNHMPFDPIWQLKEKPISYKDFKADKESSSLDLTYDYNKLIEDYLNKSKKQQLADKLKRSNEMGEGIRMVNEWRKNVSLNLDLSTVRENPNLLNDASDRCNAAGKTFNEYINAKNKRFKSKKWTIAYAKDQMNKIHKEVSQSLVDFKSVKVKDSKIKKQLNSVITQSNSLLKRIEMEQKWLADK